MAVIGFWRIRAYLSKREDTVHSIPCRLTYFHPMDFTEHNIVDGLTDDNLIGSGGSGKVYKVCLRNSRGENLAVKKIWNGPKLLGVLEKQFQEEVEILGSIRHPNIVKLLCCMLSSYSKLLVYEYMENGSLYQWLHERDQIGGSAPLEWPTRMAIAVDAARGLCYMHHDCSPPIARRDIKSSNILLDPEFKAKIADFGLARTPVKGGEPESVSSIAGSFGYMASERGSLRKINEKIDVYSFGVVLLELTTGRKANGGGGYENLAQWSWRQFQDDGFQLIDVIGKEIQGPAYLSEVEMAFKLGLICTGTVPSSRPSMKKVLQVLLH